MSNTSRQFSAQYLSQLQSNRATVVNLLSDDSLYPELSKALRIHNRGERLCQLIDSAIQYDTSIPGNIIDIETGYEWIKLPVEQLHQTHGGSKNTWGDNIERFIRLELLEPHKPDNHSEQNNTEAQNYSRDVAKKYGNGSRAATWYRIPHYTPERLAEANRRAIITKNTPLGKDATRDALGREAANRIDDSAYDIHPQTLERRKQLKTAALSRLDAEGYFYPSDVLKDALRASDAFTAAEDAKEAAEDMFTAEAEKIFRAARREKRYYEQAWKEYLTPDGLLREENLTDPHRPTKAEQIQYQLNGSKYIVTRRQ